MTLSALRREYELETIGVAILEEVRKITRSVARRYPPRVYSESSVWDEDAFAPLVQDVVADRLLKEGQLAYLFDVAQTIEDWRRLLARQVRITLAHRRVRTVVDNLLRRSVRLLREPPYSSTTIGRTMLFYVGDGPPEYRSRSSAEIRQLAESVRALPRDALSGGERAPAIYTRRTLSSLVGSLLVEAPGGVTKRDIAQVFEVLLTDWVPAILDQGDSFDQGSSNLRPDEMAEISAAAQEAVTGMSGAEKQLFAARLAGLPDTEIAPKLGISRPTLIKRRNALLDRLSSLFGNLDDNHQTTLIDEIAILLAETTGRSEENAAST